MLVDDARGFFDDFLLIPAVVIEASDFAKASFELALRLGQSDSFDATGYAIAEAIGGELWTSDRRFVNAATSAGLTAARLIP
jgi:predicted nucleic acid-binding protein